MDIHSKYPDNLQISKYLGNFSQHDNAPRYTISKSHDDPEKPGRPLPSQKGAADHFGPGQYPADRDFPTGNRLEEIRADITTRSRPSRRSAFPHEDRDRAMQKSWCALESPGPARYHKGRTGIVAGTRSQEGVNPSFSVPQHLKASGRPMTRMPTAGDHIGPGQYAAHSRFDDVGWRRSQVLKKAAQNNKETWAASQYSRIFKVIKPPRSKSSPAIAGGSGTK